MEPNRIKRQAEESVDICIDSTSLDTELTSDQESVEIEDNQPQVDLKQVRNQDMIEQMEIKEAPKQIEKKKVCPFPLLVLVNIIPLCSILVVFVVVSTVVLTNVGNAQVACNQIGKKSSNACLAHNAHATVYVPAHCQTRFWNDTAACAFVDCQEALHQGYTESGMYRISPNGKKQMIVWCEQEGHHGGWTVLQRRLNGSVDFYQTWNVYKTGFGDVESEYWLGNDNIHLLTTGRDQKLKIVMTHPNGTTAYADYQHFWIEDEVNLYNLHVSGFSSDKPLSDAFGWHNGNNFSTKDRDHDKSVKEISCAERLKGGWWYKACYVSNLNGIYGSTSTKGNGICWGWFSCYFSKRIYQSLTYVVMMVKGK